MICAKENGEVKKKPVMSRIVRADRRAESFCGELAFLLRRINAKQFLASRLMCKKSWLEHIDQSSVKLLKKNG